MRLQPASLSIDKNSISKTCALPSYRARRSMHSPCPMCCSAIVLASKNQGICSLALCSLGTDPWIKKGKRLKKKGNENVTTSTTFWSVIFLFPLSMEIYTEGLQPTLAWVKIIVSTAACSTRVFIWLCEG